MRRRRRGMIWLILLALAVVAAGVLVFLWWQGVFLPGWINWNDRVEASDTASEGVVESVVLKENGIVVYSSGSEVFRSPDVWKVQDMLWTDIDGDDIKEVLFLYWTRDNAGKEITGLTESGGLGYRQHIAVYDGASEGMNELFTSAPLTTDVASWQWSEGRLILVEPQGRQTLLTWNGERLQ